MIKRILASLAIVGLLSTTSVFALDTPGPLPGNQLDGNGNYIDNFTITPSDFDPTNEKVRIEFDLLQQAEILAYVIDSDHKSVATLSNLQTMSPGHKVFYWYGRVGNSPTGSLLDSGEYTIKAYAKVNGVFEDFAVRYATITYPTPVDEPDVYNLTAVPSSFSPEDGEDTDISFSVDQNAYLDVVVYDSTGLQEVKTFTNYNGNDWYLSGTRSITWNGRNNSGNVVSPGTYKIAVTADNNNGEETEWVNVQVVSGTVVGPTISNLDVSPDTFTPADGDTTEITFNLSQASYLDVVIEDSTGLQELRTFIDYNGNDYWQAGNRSLIWNGKDDNGDIVDPGVYKVFVSAVNNNGNDQDEITVVVSAPSSVDEPNITNLDVTPSTFDPDDQEETEITFDVDQDAYLEVVIEDSSRLNEVKTYINYNGNDWYQEGSHSIEWNGRDNSGNLVDPGSYYVVVTANNGNGDDEEEILVQVESPTSVGLIENVTLNPSTTWDPTEEELEIEFDLTDDVDSLTITAKKGSKTIEFFDEDNADEDDYEETWDGTDDDDDYVEAGVWAIVIEADNDQVVKYIEVKYEDIDIVDAFVTKTVFDPDLDEFTYLVFKVDASAVVTVEVYDGNDRELTLLDEEEVSKNRWYAVKWDGRDDDGDDLSYGTDYKFKITAENPVDDDIYDTMTVEVDLKEDDVSSNRVNVTNDSTDPVIFDEDEDGNIEITYCLDDDAEVYLAIYDGKSASGSPEIELLDYYDESEGCHTLKWNGEDDDNDELKDGIYSYKLISKSDQGYKDTEVGRFVIGNAGDGGGDDNDDDDDDDDDGGTQGTCRGYYWDLTYLSEDNELCQAIAWATEEGIFHGYPDGSFKAYQDINRAEVLKVVLEAYDVNLLPINGSNEGFSDVDPYAWYMPYVRTAKYYGMLHGYPDGTARLANTINRVELLKFVLEASESFSSYEFVNGIMNENDYADVDSNDPNEVWFYEYANATYTYSLFNTYYVDGQEYLKPGQLVERGEVALLLYRMNKAGLL